MVAGVARRPRNGIILSAALSLIATNRTALMLQKDLSPPPPPPPPELVYAHRGQGWGGAGGYSCRYIVRLVWTQCRSLVIKVVGSAESSGIVLFSRWESR